MFQLISLELAKKNKNKNKKTVKQMMPIKLMTVTISKLKYSVSNF